MPASMHHDGISWQCVYTYFVPKDQVVVIDRIAFNKNSILPIQSIVDYILVSAEPISMEQQMAAISQYLKETGEKLAQYNGRAS